MTFFEWVNLIELQVRPSVPGLVRVDVDGETVTWRIPGRGIVLHALPDSKALWQANVAAGGVTPVGQPIQTDISKLSIGLVAQQIISALRPEPS